LGWVGSSYYVGEVELLDFSGSLLFTFNVPVEFWYFLGVLTAFSIVALGFLADPAFGWTVFSVMAGGFIMVSGYFLYQQLYLQVAAIVEVPVNIGQMIIGAIVALPVVKVVRRALPQLRQRS
jgi:hypothetical protein